MKTKTATIAFSLVFAIPFLSVGIFSTYMALSMLYGWQQARTWEPVPAEILAVRLDTHYGRKSTTYELKARYRYQYHGRSYESTRVGFSGSGADNIGSWQEDWHDILQQAREEGRPVQVWIDPAQPEEAVIDRSVRWAKFLFLMPFVILFSAVGIGASIVCWKALRTPAGEFDKPAAKN